MYSLISLLPADRHGHIETLLKERLRLERAEQRCGSNWKPKSKRKRRT